MSVISESFTRIWDARAYLVRLCAVPLAVRLICFTLAISYAGESFTTFMLIMLPSLLAQGWMLAHFVRFLVMGQTWPFRPTGNLEADLGVLEIRARGVLGGMIVFVLINMVVGLFSEGVRLYMEPFMTADGALVPNPDIPPEAAFVSFSLLILMFMGFRFLWLYIPFALGMGAKTYIRDVKSVSNTMFLMGVWAACFIPFLLLIALAKGFIGTPVAAIGGTGAATFIIIIVTVIGDMLKSLFVTGGITIALRDIFKRDGAR